MKKILLIMLLYTAVSYSQNKDVITDAVKSVLTDNVKGLSDNDLKVLIERYNKANKEIKDAKDFSIETKLVAKTEFDTVSELKKAKIYQLKAETEGNYFVVKYIDLDLPLDSYTALRKTYEDLVQTPGEAKDAFMTRKKAAHDAKNKANPFKVYYGYLKKDVIIQTRTSSLMSLNIATVPFKIFPKTKYPSSVNGSIDNVGLYTGFKFQDLSILKANGTETKSSIGAGIYLAPSVVKLDKDNSSITDDKEINKMYLTTAIALHFKYKNFTLMAIPFGIDTAFSSSGKIWDYDGKYWWGFGLGIDTSLFNF